MGLVMPPKSAGALARIRGVVLVILLIVAVLALAFGIVKLIALPFGGISLDLSIFYGLALVVVAVGVLVVLRPAAPEPDAGRARGADRRALRLSR